MSETRKIAIGVLAGLVVGALGCGITVGLIVSNAAKSAQRELTTELTRSREALVDASWTIQRFTDSDRHLRSELERATGIVAADKLVIAEQQRTIAEQQRLIDSLKHGLDDFAGSLTEGLGDIRRTAVAIADGLKRLYGIYHQSSEGR